MRDSAVPEVRAKIASRFALLSPCGHGNLGDAAIQDAVIDNLRRRLPQASFVGITLQPFDTERRHGIPAYPIGARSLSGYGLAPKGKATSRGAAQGDPGSLQPQHSQSPRRTLRSAAVALAKAVVPRSVVAHARLTRLEFEHIGGAIALLRDVETLVVSGGGQLDDYWGGAWGHPYALAKWVLLARLLGRRVVVLSVGFGSLDSRVSRFFVRFALRLTHYRSYRDDGSRQRMHGAGFRIARVDPVLPDLAFSLGDGSLLSENPHAETRRIGISPMAYCDPRVWPRRDGTVYTQYLERLATLTVGLVKSGYAVSLLASDGPDHRAVQELLEIVRARLPSDVLPDVPPSQTVDEFMRAAAGMEIIVASRLHGLVLSLLVGTPVIALSYDRKVADMMDAVGQQAYCLDIECSGVEEIERALHALESRSSLERAALREQVAAFRRQLDPQYDLVAVQR